MLLTNMTSAVITTNQWRRWKLSGMRPGSIYTLPGFQRPFSTHSCNARAEYGVSICDVFGFYGAFFIVLFLTIFWN